MQINSTLQKAAERIRIEYITIKYRGFDIWTIVTTSNTYIYTVTGWELHIDVQNELEHYINFLAGEQFKLCIKKEYRMLS